MNQVYIHLLRLTRVTHRRLSRTAIFVGLMKHHMQAGSPGLLWGLCGQQGPSLLHFVAPPPSTCDVMALNGYLAWKYHICIPDCAMEEGGEACGPLFQGTFTNTPLGKA